MIMEINWVRFMRAMYENIKIAIPLSPLIDFQISNDWEIYYDILPGFFSTKAFRW